MKISVIVPTYKPQTYLWTCLDSLAEQTFPKEDFEVLLVLNGCCEPYNSQINAWLSKHVELQVRYFQTDVAGVSNARNIALDNAVGEFVTFIDDDDYVSPDFLQELFEKSSSDTIAVCYPYAFQDGDVTCQLPYSIKQQYEQYASEGTIPYTRVRKYFSGPCMKLIPMSFIHDRRFDVTFANGEDSIFMFLISDRFNTVSFTSREAIYYRRYRSNSAMTSNRARIDVIQNSLRMLKKYISIYFKHPFSYNFVFFFTRLLATFHSMVK